MATDSSQSIRTLEEVMNFMSPFAGGSVPDSNDNEYTDWKRWINQKQEEYAVRGFWRRLLTRLSVTLDGGTHLLPDNFHKHNGVYVLDVNGVDWADPENTDDQVIFVEMVTDKDDVNFGKWRIVFSTEADNQSATLWYFANPPLLVDSTDILLLPGDMVGYGALGEYFRTTGAEGSQDKAEEDAENRFNTYISLEMIPPKYELLHFATRGSQKVDRLAIARDRYYRPNRNTQG